MVAIVRDTVGSREECKYMYFLVMEQFSVLIVMVVTGIYTWDKSCIELHTPLHTNKCSLTRCREWNKLCSFVNTNIPMLISWL